MMIFRYFDIKCGNEDSKHHANKNIVRHHFNLLSNDFIVFCVWSRLSYESYIYVYELLYTKINEGEEN